MSRGNSFSKGRPANLRKRDALSEKFANSSKDEKEGEKRRTSPGLVEERAARIARSVRS